MIPKPFTSYRDERYLEFIRKQKCLVCSRKGCVPHHEGPHSQSKKCDDYRAIPLCPHHHTLGPLSIHSIGRRGFEKGFEVNTGQAQITLMVEYLYEELNVNVYEQTIKFLIEMIQKEKKQ